MRFNLHKKDSITDEKRGNEAEAKEVIRIDQFVENARASNVVYEVYAEREKIIVDLTEIIIIFHSNQIFPRFNTDIVLLLLSGEK